jgi:hypothetical protein
MCLITTGANTKNDAFIEIYYYIKYAVIAGEQYITGKMTFSASAEYIGYWFNAVGSWGGPNGYGIPMFVQPSHNQF